MYTKDLFTSKDRTLWSSCQTTCKRDVKKMSNQCSASEREKWAAHLRVVMMEDPINEREIGCLPPFAKKTALLDLQTGRKGICKHTNRETDMNVEPALAQLTPVLSWGLHTWRLSHQLFPVDQRVA